MSTLAPSSLASMAAQRSEEHTSELQSPCNLVCRLLLEKKKKTYIRKSPNTGSPHTNAGTCLFVPTTGAVVGIACTAPVIAYASVALDSLVPLPTRSASA